MKELSGSEKQIAWAEKIRQDKLESIRECFLLPCHRSHPAHKDEIPVREKALETLEDIKEASWWIDHRNQKFGDLFRNTMEEVSEKTETEKTGLPTTLTGSEKQIELAEKIRTERFAEITEKLGGHLPENALARWTATKEKLSTITKASWWIENSSKTTGRIALNIERGI